MSVFFFPYATNIYQFHVLFLVRHIFPLFPFNKFSTILEYGGSYGSSRIATISPKFVTLPQIHLLKVELKEFSVPKALCEGFDTSQHLDHTMVTKSISFIILQRMWHPSLKWLFFFNLYKLLFLTSIDSIKKKI